MTKGDVEYRKDHFCSWEEKNKMSEKQTMNHPPLQKKVIVETECFRNQESTV